MSRIEKELCEPDGSWEVSGTESQRIMRLELELIAAHTFVESANEPADNGFELLDAGGEVSWEKELSPL
jgi:hypothetical protein